MNNALNKVVVGPVNSAWTVRKQYDYCSYTLEKKKKKKLKTQTQNVEEQTKRSLNTIQTKLMYILLWLKQVTKKYISAQCPPRTTYSWAGAEPEILVWGSQVVMLIY